MSDGIVVLMYHRVGTAGNAWERKYCVSPQRFAGQMAALAAQGMQAVPLEALLAWLDGGAELAPGSFVLTFDDGFAGVHEHALPVLERLGWPFTVFLVSNLIGTYDEWTRAENPSGTTHPLLDTAAIRAMQARGVDFQSHTRNHASLPTLDAAGLADELGGSRTALGELLGREVHYLAYPFGHVDDRVEAATRAAGYRAAFSTQAGFNRRGVDRYRIRRLDVYGSDSAAMLLRKVRLGSNEGSLQHAASYYLRRLAARLPGAQA